MRKINFLPKGRKKDFCIIEGGEEHAMQQRNEILRQLFNNKYKCRICRANKNIHIHHLYQYAPHDVITTYEDFLLIPWIPLCKKCHSMQRTKLEEDNG